MGCEIEPLAPATSGFILPKAIRAVRRFALDMNVLMTVAVIGAAAIGEWSEGAAVAFLFALSELLEAFSLNRARKAIKSLFDLSPVTALRKEGSEFREVRVEEVKISRPEVIRHAQPCRDHGNPYEHQHGSPLFFAKLCSFFGRALCVFGGSLW
jgi:hypothetical protein